MFDDYGLSARAVEVMRASAVVFIEQYTSAMPGMNLSRLAFLIGKPPVPVSRRELEEEGGKRVLEEASKAPVTLAVPGDPFVATTHVTLRGEAARVGIPTFYVPGSSVFSAAYGASGLQVYRAGPSCTVVEPTPLYHPVSQYQKILSNMASGLHTLVLLDIAEPGFASLTFARAARLFTDYLAAKGVSGRSIVAVGLAGLGSLGHVAAAGTLESLSSMNVEPMPQCMVVPGVPDEAEAKALIELGASSQEIAAHVAACKRVG